ncbi:MAG: hypothetical protein U0L18_11545 [Acutalibacteraceae bacterium]|nr:hypothetical protein [Acutalibacteraceae bacterium]
MNTDNYFDSYIKTLINTNIDNTIDDTTDDTKDNTTPPIIIKYRDFKTLIELFSKFIAFTNPDYKYNGTYLQEYVNDFYDVIEKLKKKNDIYSAISSEIKFINRIDYELYIDNSYQYTITKEYDSSKRRLEEGYYAFDSEKIKSDNIEITLYLKSSNEKKYLFSRKYNLSEENYIEKINNDVSKFYNNFLEKEGLQDEKNEFN